MDALVALEAQSFTGDRLSRRSLRRFVGRPSAQLVVATDSGIVGYALTLFRQGGRSARIYSLAVAETSRGQGVGRCLIADAVRRARERDCKTINLEVRVDNAAAQALYAAVGFTPRGERPGYYADGSDARLLTLHLEESA